jgi:arylsulfatase A-like enzyme/Tfp pilus assembly protein PilF
LTRKKHAYAQINRSGGRGVILIAAMLLFAACRGREPRSVLIVTFDTARADAFGVYGSRSGASPAVDRIAARGVVFESATATAPLTLPSHTSLFTGTFPPRHGVRENGNNNVPESLVTLAELFHGQGYRTGAFVAAYVLDARWGLNQGFDTYSGNFDATNPDVFSLADLQRPANEVIDDALRWLQSGRKETKPFFAWVHLFDPHMPYAPPSPFRERYTTNPYAGEIAFADSQLARLLDDIDLDKTIIVIAGDHGEGFGEHEEHGHGLLLYEETLHVPLIIATPDGLPRGLRVVTPVSLVDVYPTVAELAGLQSPPAIQGHSLVPLCRGSRTHATPIYAETLYPRRRFGWSELLALRDGSRKLIDSSRPELYDLQQDPRERRDLAAARPDALREQRGQLRKAVAALEKNSVAQASLPVDAEARARLAALGYVAGPARTTAGGLLPSPRDKIRSFEKLNDARAKMAAGNSAEAERQLTELVRAEPNMLEAHVAFGELYLRERRFPESAAAFRNAYALGPDDPSVIAALATAEVHSGRADAAMELLRTAIERNPTEPRFRFIAGRASLVRGDLKSATSHFDVALKLNPRSAASLVELAGIAITERQPERARQLATRALAIDAHARGARLFLAQALEQLGRPNEAWQQASEELKLSPDDFRPAYYLAELAPRVGHDDEVERYLQQTIRAEPRFPAAYLQLARHLLQRGGRFDEGIRLTRKALELKPRGRDEALAYFLLADLYSRTGHADLSRKNADLARGVLARINE